MNINESIKETQYSIENHRKKIFFLNYLVKLQFDD